MPRERSCRFENSKGKDMHKIVNIAFGSSVSSKLSTPKEISFSGHHFQVWAILETFAYIAWYSLHPASFILAVSIFYFKRCLCFFQVILPAGSLIFVIFCSFCSGLLGDNGPQKSEGRMTAIISAIEYKVFALFLTKNWLPEFVVARLRS